VKPARLGLGAVGLALGVLLVLALREATLSTHTRVEPDSQIELLVAASSEGAEPGQTLTEMTTAQLLNCRLEVKSDLVGSLVDLGHGRYRARFAPAMDETDRRQFRGCLSDWVIDHLHLDVIHLRELS